MKVDGRDEGWAWVVLAAAFFTLFISAVPFAVGVYVSELIIEDILSRPQVALFGSLQIGALYMSGILSPLTRFLSHRVLLFIFSILGSLATIASIYVKSANILYFTFGILPGLSAGVLSLQSLVMVNRYFKKRAYLANCICLCGSAFANIVLPPFFRFLIEIYGWKTSLFIVSGLYLQGCVLSMCMKPISIKHFHTPSISKVQIVDRKYKSIPSVLYNPQLYAFLVANILWSYSISVVFVMLPNLLHEQHILIWQSNLILSSVGAATLAGKLMSAYVFNVIKISEILAHIFGTLIMAFSLILYVVYPTFPLLLTASLLFGLSFGLTACTQSTVSCAIGKLKHYNLVYSLVYEVCTIGASGGPPFSGMIYNVSSSYTTTFLVTSGVTFSSAAVMAITTFVTKMFRSKNLSQSKDVEHLTIEILQD